MKVENLYNGQSFKNYKDMCTQLEMEIKNSTNSKKSQYEELSLFCKYSKSGHKITIDEVYETPLPKVENRGGSRNIIYNNIIQLLITDLLAQCDGHISISRSKLMLTLGMINHNYSTCGANIPKLSKYMEMDEKIVYDFYNINNSNFKKTIENALKNLMDKRIIMYNTIIKVREFGSHAHRTATESELEIIMEIERDTLKELGYSQVSLIRISKDWRKFREKIKRLLQKKSEIEFYYTAYDITVNSKYIEEERLSLFNLLLDKVELKENKKELNDIVYSQVITNAEIRHEAGFTAGKKAKIRLADSYIECFKQLANLLISSDTPNINNQVLSVKLETEIFSNELIDEIDKLFA